MEVLLAAGALNTPKLLHLSGIGPRPLLEAHNIPVLVPLPGVGANYQDHPAVFSVLNYSVTIPAPSMDANMLRTNSTYAAQMMAEYKANRTGPYTVSVGNLASFLPLPLIAPNDYQAIIKSARHASAAAFLPPTTDPTIQAGFAAQKELLLRAFERGTVAVDEFIINSDLTPLWALQKPLSRGYVEISSADPFTPPNIQPRTAADPIDVAILLEAIKHTRRFYASAGMVVFKPVETEVVLDEAVVREKLVPTFDHPSCSCAMQPRRLGGVVDPWLRVYGVSGLRIVDASIIPIIPAAHLQSTMYVISEKAADIIRGLGNTK
jgi:choline dehydrogenase-like flavoprotein